MYHFYTRLRLYPKLKRWKSTRCGVLILIGIVVIWFNEILFYQRVRTNWPDIDELSKITTIEKLLVVADSQLIGEKNEGMLGFLTRKDADRYLAKTFSEAYAYVKPDWIVFLGDIFNEGLSASDDEFQRYFERFDAIFDYKTHKDRCIIIPGDNDVGGGYDGDKQPILRERFQNYFGQLIAVYRQNDIQFLKLDMDLSDSYIEGKRSAIMEQMQNRPMTVMFRIVLNHWPILTRTNRFTEPFINELEPNLILKGDNHHFSITQYDRKSMLTSILVQDDLKPPILELELVEDNLVYEISVPTCSYRMGVERTGYVALFLDSENKTARVTILWTPRRYLSLVIYVIYGIFAVLFWIFTSIFSRQPLKQLFKLPR